MNWIWESTNFAYIETAGYMFGLSRSTVSKGWQVQASYIDGRTDECGARFAGISYAECGIGSVNWDKAHAVEWANTAVLRWLDPEKYDEMEAA